MCGDRYYTLLSGIIKKLTLKFLISAHIYLREHKKWQSVSITTGCIMWASCLINCVCSARSMCYSEQDHPPNKTITSTLLLYPTEGKKTNVICLASLRPTDVCSVASTTNHASEFKPQLANTAASTPQYAFTIKNSSRNHSTNH